MANAEENRLLICHNMERARIRYTTGRPCTLAIIGLLILLGSAVIAIAPSFLVPQYESASDLPIMIKLRAIAVLDTVQRSASRVDDTDIWIEE